LEQFLAVRVNPTGELPEPMHPIEGNSVLNAKDGFELDEADKVILANHPTQGAGHFLIDATGIVRWMHIEGRDGPEGLCTFPTAAQIIAAAGSLAR
jgi:hypothetical protein